MNKPKIVITGHSNHGKTTVCRYLKNRDVGLGTYTCSSTSKIACNEFLFTRLKDRFLYEDRTECYMDRNRNSLMRSLWYEEICKFNNPKYRLGKLILEKNDICEGVRCIEELTALRDRGFVNFVVWVDASKRILPQPNTSITVTPGDCDFILDNNGNELSLEHQIESLWETIETLWGE